jgi:two-component system sensor histidine kinase RegB
VRVVRRDEEPAQREPQVLRNLSWLVKLRWVAVVGQALAIGVGVAFVGLPHSTAWWMGLIVLTNALLNGVVGLRLRSATRASPWMLTSLLAVDLVLLTGLLALSGGPSNPFSVLYLVNVALGAVVLRARDAWVLVALSTLSFAALFASLDPHAMHMHDGDEMRLHLQGMWLAFAIAAAVIGYFVTRVTRDLEEERARSVQAQLEAARNERLASLATLAAGAAHELATPLSTIAVVAKELSNALRARESDLVPDIALIREEVGRCRAILQDMSSDAGESAGDPFRALSADELVTRILEGVSQRERVYTQVSESERRVSVPPRALSRAVRGLVKNALEASSAQVTLSASFRGDELVLDVRDQGPGMGADVLARVGEPFFSTKAAGTGMGLGVFLARATVERLGGTFQLRSAPDEGTEVTLVLRPNAAWQARLVHGRKSEHGGD